ncbi:TRAP transporter substrate-binding protein [Ideonella sp. BN130291]|uniref:TRAP transporter substrate-binding protein n=1 Tax=Ideonella sp. BN130291 TaxID=3112940 RepID=UPI002E261F51|nr:TRAP transporter substrate-binding protein [Ideonella sp. BN130291]
MNPVMDMRNTLRSCALAAGLAAAMAGAWGQTTWQLATGYRADSFHTENLRQFAREAAAATQGALQIEVHPNNSLARLNDIRAQVEAGQIAAGEVIMTSLVKEVAVAGADSVPFVVGSYEDARRLWQHQRPVVEQALAQRGLVPLYAVPWPSQGLYTTRPIASAADLKGSRMRTYNATTVRIAELLGAAPVDVPMADVGKALASGRMDSMITSGVTGVENKVWDHLKYFYDIKAWFPKNLVLVNKARFDALTAEQREAVRRAAQVAEERGWAASEQASAASLRELASHGVHIEAPSFEFRNELRRYGDKFSVEWVRATGRDASTILIPYYTAGAARTPLVSR